MLSKRRAKEEEGKVVTARTAVKVEEERTAAALHELVEEFFRTGRLVVLEAYERGLGRQTLSEVLHRKRAEDVKIEADDIGDGLWKALLSGSKEDLQVLRKMLAIFGSVSLVSAVERSIGKAQELKRRHPILGKIRVHSEHGEYGSSDPLIICYIDPLDGSDEFRNRISGCWYIAVSFFSKALKPIAAAMLDIGLGEMFFVPSPRGDGKVHVKFFDSGRERFESPISAKVLPKKGTILVYMGRENYLRSFLEVASFVHDEAYEGLTLHGKGGSFIYAWLAAGRGLAYIMANEPVNEILPGIGFAKLMGCPVWVVWKDGRREQFDIERHGKLARVDYLVVACNERFGENLLPKLKLPQPGWLLERELVMV